MRSLDSSLINHFALFLAVDDMLNNAADKIKQGAGGIFKKD
jgi:hypothetical protein